MGLLQKLIKNTTFLFLIWAFIPKTYTETETNIHLFYSLTCGFCKKEVLYLEEYVKSNPGVTVRTYEITGNKENRRLLSYIGHEIGLDIRNIPFTVIGDEYFLGFGEKHKNLINEYTEKAASDNSTDFVENLINEKNIKVRYDTIKYENVVGDTALSNGANKDNEQNISSGDKAEEVKFPLIGIVKLKDLSLPLLTFVIALLDGFNPCAMWTLLFLISLILGMEDRLKMWILGLTFIIASGLVYFLFLAAWLNFFLVVGFTTILRYIIGFAAILIGVHYLNDYVKNKDKGCQIIANEKRQKVFQKLKEITQNKSFALSLIGIILLALAVNMVELLCSAGLPAVYTDILSMSNLPAWKYYSYLTFYIIIFMLDDIIVFAIAMITLKAIGIESKYTRFSHLIGGIIVILIGLVLIINPEILAL
ncbi:hypothetical protein JXA34_02300 [Patescibacteria group bacterium]|nr:hypothetical protein [Patescibacteria group bacterium]